KPEPGHELAVLLEQFVADRVEGGGTRAGVDLDADAAQLPLGKVEPFVPADQCRGGRLVAVWRGQGLLLSHAGVPSSPVVVALPVATFLRRNSRTWSTARVATSAPAMKPTVTCRQSGSPPAGAVGGGASGGFSWLRLRRKSPAPRLASTAAAPIPRLHPSRGA